MAIIGASRPFYAKYRKIGNTVQYYDGGIMGALVNFNIALEANNAANDFYANNAVQETQKNKFSSGTVTISTDDLRSNVSKAILGLKEVALTGITGITDAGAKELVYDDDQNTPYLGIGMVQKKQINGEERWRAVILKKVAFDVPADAAETEGESINWQTPELSGTVMRDDTVQHQWKAEATFTTESQAIAYIRNRLNVPASTNAFLSAINIGELTLTPTFAKSTLSYTATATGVSDIVSATAEDGKSFVQISVNDEEVENGDEIPWETGDNEVEIVVTAEDGTTTKTYNVTVTKS